MSVSTRWLALWLAAVGLALAAVILLGGQTRLTQSGLAITDWEPVTGILPPLTEEQWQEEFRQYRQIPQYRLLWPSMDIAGFKAIYWPEWTHRFAARFAGLLFVLPLIFFWRRGVLTLRHKRALSLILALGLLQAFIGWFMVQSGLTAGVQVSHYRLAIHLALAFILYGAVFWLLLEVIWPRQKRPPPLLPLLLAALLFGQIVLGALAAGLDAGLIHNSWPDMSGAFIPPDVFGAAMFSNPAAVQFYHRLGAYAFVLLLALYLARRNNPARLSAYALAALALMQTGIGIYVVLLAAPRGAALLHQLGGLVLWSQMLVHLHNTRPVNLDIAHP